MEFLGTKPDGLLKYRLVSVWCGANGTAELRSGCGRSPQAIAFKDDYLDSPLSCWMCLCICCIYIYIYIHMMV